MLMDPTRETACGLTLLQVQQIMADRVTIWADRQHVNRLAREARAEAIAATRAIVRRARVVTKDGQRCPWMRRPGA